MNNKKFYKNWACWDIFYFPLRRLVKTEVGKIVGVPYLNYITYDSKRATNYGRLWYGIKFFKLYLRMYP